MKTEVTTLQRSLQKANLYPGMIDGLFGPLTLAGVMQHNTSPPYMRIAAGEYGVSEIAGARHNPRIIEYHSATSLEATTDEVPWCSSFVNWVMAYAALPHTRSAMARSWLKWGVESATPKVNDIAVLSRGAPPSGHVGFIVHITPSGVYLLGGNQNNRVNVTRYPISRLLQARKLK